MTQVDVVTSLDWIIRSSVKAPGTRLVDERLEERVSSKSRGERPCKLEVRRGEVQFNKLS